MADVKRDILFRFLGDARGIQDAAKNAEKSLASVSDKMADASKKLSGWGTTMTRNVTLPLVAAGAAAFKFAVDTNESLNKVSVVFGAQSTAIDDWSKTTAKGFGISRRASLEAAGTFGNLFVSMGLGQDESAKMSRSLVELAADLGSFNNIPVDTALEKLRAGLVGEVEPLRVLGVQLNAAMVEAKALEMGLVDLEGNVTEAGKVQARYALIVEQTATAQGDFARTSEDAANSLKITAASASDALAKFGEKAIPLGEKLINNVLIPAVDWFAALDEGTQTWIGGLGVGLAVTGPAMRGLAAVLDILSKIAKNPGFSLLLGGVAVWELIIIAKGDEIFDWFLQQRDKVSDIPVIGGIKEHFDEKSREGAIGVFSWIDTMLGTNFTDRLSPPQGFSYDRGQAQYGQFQTAMATGGTVNVNVTDWRIWDPSAWLDIGRTVVTALDKRTQASAGSVSSRYQARAN